MSYQNQIKIIVYLGLQIKVAMRTFTHQGEKKKQKQKTYSLSLVFHSALTKYFFFFVLLFPLVASSKILPLLFLLVSIGCIYLFANYYIKCALTYVFHAIDFVFSWLNKCFINTTQRNEIKKLRKNYSKPTCALGNLHFAYPWSKT